MGSRAEQTVADRREQVLDREVRTIAVLNDGTVQRGIVADVSTRGVRVNCPAAGVKPGDELALVLVFLTGERVRYRCEVKHVDPGGRYFGAEFKSPPNRIK